MTRLVRIQNMQPAESLQPLIAALHSVAGRPTEFKIDPQREVFIAIHDASPMISIGKEPIAESDLPTDTVLATARSASDLQRQLDEAHVENQQLRADKDALATEVARLTAAAAEHKPEGASEDILKQIEQLRGDNKVLADAYEKRFEELKAAETKLTEMTADRDAHAARIDQLTAQLHAIQPPPPPVNEQEQQPKPLDDMNKAELLQHAETVGAEVSSTATKAEIKDAITAAQTEEKA